MKRDRLITMMEIAIMAGIGGVLSYYVALRLWPQGGSASLAMVPIVILAFRRGWVAGVVCGLLVGLINLMISPYITHPIQVVLDYPLPYALLGLAGWFRPVDEKGAISIKRMGLGVTIAGLARLIPHFISGVVWFGSYAPEGWPVVLYSLCYNASYLVIDVLVTIILMSYLLKKAPQLVASR
ncbi:energy-coupled thiamine transporter ThiT [Marininema halotolerans]|uniref:Thiamine transporter n=1 Tax=Marininema halotolerans TaxID=1155944 RepID=A0A1I6QFE7_9BACL|nr:energy-coupled thiamine transporter ThiT [Marininema halotolerans]SFS51197.1 thiamine transporter [Marininema halotolerans]